MKQWQYVVLFHICKPRRYNIVLVIGDLCLEIAKSRMITDHPSPKQSLQKTDFFRVLLYYILLQCFLKILVLLTVVTNYLYYIKRNLAVGTGELKSTKMSLIDMIEYGIQRSCYILIQPYLQLFSYFLVVNKRYPPYIG